MKAIRFFHKAGSGILEGQRCALINDNVDLSQAHADKKGEWGKDCCTL
jgi:hypothetical protein